MLMLAIPLPLLVTLNMPWKKKVVLVVILQIIAAILTKVFNLSDIYSPVYMLWYTRESSVAIYVANLPMIWSLLLEIFPPLRSATNSISKRKISSHAMPLSTMSNNKKNTRNAHRLEDDDDDDVRGSSQEIINGKDEWPKGIRADTTIDIDEESMDDEMYKSRRRDQVTFDWETDGHNVYRAGCVAPSKSPPTFRVDEREV